MLARTFDEISREDGATDYSASQRERGISGFGVIGFEHHRICCILGEQPHERVHEQDLFVDLHVEADISHCVNSDCLEDTVDYVAMAELCTELAIERKFYLMEAYAAAVLDAIIEKFEVKRARIKVKKPLAIPSAEFAYIELERVRGE